MQLAHADDCNDWPAATPEAAVPAGHREQETAPTPLKYVETGHGMQPTPPRALL